MPSTPEEQDAKVRAHFAESDRSVLELPPIRCRRLALTRLTMLVVAAVLQMAGCTPAGLVSAETAVARMENERLEAIVRNDLAALERMLAPDYTAITSQNPGRVTARADAIAVNSPERRKIQSWVPRDVVVRIYGNTGLVTGVAEVVDVLRGESRHVMFQYSHLWVKRNGKWLLVHRHVNRVADLKESERH